MSEKLILVDGTALAYRSYFAFMRRHLISSRGEITSTSFGFINSILKLKRIYNPDYLVISFDLGAPTIRHRIYPEYKSTRAKMPDDMVETLPRLYQIADALNLPVVEREGVEADDIIGTLAVKGAEKCFGVYIYTGDKDFFQLVNNKINIIIPGRKGDEDIILDPQGVKAKFGVPPDKVVDVLALMGDSADNIPGVPGIGPKTAIQLINQYGSFDHLFASISSLTKKSLKEKLSANREQAELSKQLVIINTSIDLQIDWGKFRVSEPNLDKLLPLLKELEFEKLLDEFSPGAALSEKKANVDYRLIKNIGELKELAKELEKAGQFAIDTETTSLQARKAELVGISISYENGKAYYLPMGHNNTDKNLPLAETISLIGKLCRDDKLTKIAQNLKYDLQVLKNYNLDIRGPQFDTMLASYVLNPSARQHGLSALAMEYLNYSMQGISELIGKGKKQKSFAEVPVEDAVFYSCEDADITHRLYNIFKTKLAENKLEKVFYEIEMPLVEVLRSMEEVGIRVDKNKLKEISKHLADELDKLTAEIYEYSGYEFNINSPIQLQKVLFDDLKLPSKGKTAKRAGLSTDASVLEELAEIHPLPKLLLEYRELMKVKSTYSDALVELIDPQTERIHTSFNQAVTATGRLSSANPNLQNIPVRTELGREVREAFIPTNEDYTFLSADYSQIELRLVAHIADDKAMIESFLRDEDIHTRTAAEVFGVDIEDVTPDMRRKSKITNFSIIYGVSPYGLSRQAEMSVQESKQFIDIYFRRYPGVKKYMEEIVKFAEEKGYVSTIFGRRRYIPDIKSRNHQVREFAKRTAINTPIQGSAADVIKLAMIKIYNELSSRGFKSKMVLQVHDELLFDVYLAELGDIREIIKNGMENVIELKVPLRVEIGIGKNWLEAH